MSAGLPDLARSVDFETLRHDPIKLGCFIEKHGVAVELRRSVPCPCVAPDTNIARIDCTACRGAGRTYPQSLRDNTRALVTGRQWNRQVLDVGQLVTGMVNVTFMPGIIPGAGDQLWPDNDRHVVHQLVPTRYRAADQPRVSELLADDGDLDRVRQKVVGDRLLYPDVLEVEYAGWYDGQRLIAVEEGTDYQLVSRDTYTEVLWKEGRAPKPGSNVTWRYIAAAVYMLEPSEPRYRQDGDIPLPYHAQAWRLDKWAEHDLR